VGVAGAAAEGAAADAVGDDVVADDVAGAEVVAADALLCPKIADTMLPKILMAYLPEFGNAALASQITLETPIFARTHSAAADD